VLDEPDNTTTNPPGPNEPSAAEVQAQLERILASRCFEQAARGSRFLRYAVEQTLAGHGERLKGYTIAVEAFDRPADFDAQSDPLVRVEAGRLRRRLIEYYATEGQQDPVRIELPRGSYAVVWSYAKQADGRGSAPSAAADGAVPVAQPSVRNRRRRRRIRALLVATVILVGFGVIVWQEREFSRLARDYPTFAEALAQGRPPIVVVPFEDLGNEARSRSLAGTLTEEVLIELDEHELFVIATEPRGANGVDPAATARSAGKGGAGYILSGSVRYTPDSVRITARLVLAATGTQIWSAPFDEPRSIANEPIEQERIARAIASVAAPYGPVFDAELARIAAVPPESPGVPDCMLGYYQYRRDLNPALHAEVLRCFAGVTEREPRHAEVWGAVALLLVDAYAYGYEGAQLTGTPLDRAREAARTAMDIDGDNLFANLALARVQFFSRSEFQRAAEHALARRPNSTEALSLVGTMFVLGGDLARGLPLVDRAIELSPRPPGIYYAAKALGHLRGGEYDEALAAALRIDSPNWPMGHAITTSMAALAGREDIAVRERDRLRTLAGSGQELRAVTERWPIDERLRTEFRRGLDLANRIETISDSARDGQ